MITNKIYQQLNLPISQWNIENPVSSIEVDPKIEETIHKIFVSANFWSSTIPTRVSIIGGLLSIFGLFSLNQTYYQYTKWNKNKSAYFISITLLIFGILGIGFKIYHQWKRNQNWNDSFNNINNVIELEAIRIILQGVSLEKRKTIFCNLKFHVETSLYCEAVKSSCLTTLLFLKIIDKNLFSQNINHALPRARDLKTAKFLIALAPFHKKTELFINMCYSAALEPETPFFKEVFSIDQLKKILLTLSVPQELIDTPGDFDHFRKAISINQHLWRLNEDFVLSKIHNVLTQAI